MRHFAIAATLVLSFAAPCSAEVLASSDGGKTWKSAGLAGKAIDEIVADPKDAKTAYAFVGDDCMNRTELHKTSDAGKTWTALTPGVDLHCLVIDPANPQALWVGGREMAYAVSNDGGKTWTKGEIRVAAGGFGKRNIRGFAFQGKSIFAAGGQGDGFVAQSDDGGKTWTQAKLELGYVWAAAATAAAVLVGGDSGLFVSTDGGKSFTAQGGLKEQPGVGGRFSVSADGKRAVFAFRGTTIASTDAGKSWSALAAPKENSFVHSLAWVGKAQIVTTLGGKWQSEGDFKMFQPDGGSAIWTSSDGKKWTEAKGISGKPTVVAASADGHTAWLGTR